MLAFVVLILTAYVVAANNVTGDANLKYVHPKLLLPTPPAFGKSETFIVTDVPDTIDDPVTLYIDTVRVPVGDDALPDSCTATPCIVMAPVINVPELLT